MMQTIYNCWWTMQHGGIKTVMFRVTRRNGSELKYGHGLSVQRGVIRHDLRYRNMLYIQTDKHGRKRRSAKRDTCFDCYRMVWGAFIRELPISVHRKFGTGGNRSAYPRFAESKHPKQGRCKVWERSVQRRKSFSWRRQR